MIRPGLETGVFRRRWDSEVCILSDTSRKSLIERSRRVRRYINDDPDIKLRDIAFSLAGELSGTGCRLAVVASSPEDLTQKLSYAEERLSDSERSQIKDRNGIYFFSEPLAENGKTAFLFPGEGSQYLNMLADLCLQFPEVRESFDVADRAFASHERGYVPSQFLFPKPDRGETSGDDSLLWQMDGAVEAVFTANLALHKLLKRLEIRPDVVVGHSTGEYSALMAAGAVTLADDQHLISMMQDLNSLYVSLADEGQIPEAVLMAVGAARHGVVTSLLEEMGDGLYLAMDNCPHQVVLCGDDAAITAAEQKLRQAGAVCERLRFNRPYHTPLFRDVCRPLEDFFARLPIQLPDIEIYSCATAQPIPADLEEIRTLGVAQWALPVRFRETVEELYRNGVRLFVEVGPRGNLSAFVSDTLRGRPHLAVPVDVPSRSGIEQLNHLVALLAAHRVPLSTDRLYRGRGCAKLSFDTAGRDKPTGKKSTISLCSSLPALQLDETGFSLRATRHSAPPSRESHPTPEGGGVTAAPATEDDPVFAGTEPFLDGRARMMQEYLHANEQLLTTQRRVMLAFLERASTHPSPVSTQPRVQETAAVQPEKGASAQRPATPPPSSLPAGTNLPVIGEVLLHVEGRSLVTRFDITLGEHPYLRHHTLGSRVSENDPDLTALPLVMLTMAMEFLAQAAAQLIPGSVVVGMSDILAHKWIALTGDKLMLEVQAERNPEKSHQAVQVVLRQIESTGQDLTAAAAGSGLTLLEATVHLASDYPDAPTAAPFELSGARSSRWSRKDLYSKVMFHGPKLQGVVSVDRWSDDGAEVSLLALPHDELFGGAATHQFLTDPVLLDAAGQVVGFWTAEHLESGFTVFPFRVAEVRFFGPAMEAGQELKCQARLKLSGESYVRADFDVVRGDGRLHVQVKGWEDKRIPLSDEFFGFRFSPGDIVLSHHRAMDAETGNGISCSLEFPDRLMETEGRIWREGLAHLILSRGERQEWRNLNGTEDERTQWLLERAAAKDAVRLHVADRSGTKLRPADIEISPGPNGDLSAGGSWTKTAGDDVVVSTFYSNGTADATIKNDDHEAGMPQKAVQKKGEES